MSDTNEELHGMVRDIVVDLEAAAEGSLYKADDGEFEVIDDLDEWKRNKYEKEKEEFVKDHPVDKVVADMGYGSYDEFLEANGYDDYDDYVEEEIGTADDIDDPDEASLYDYIEHSSLGDIRFEIDSEGDLLGGKILFTYGGPNIWVHDDRVCGYWGSQTVEMGLDSGARSALFDCLQEFYEHTKEVLACHGR